MRIRTPLVVGLALCVTTVIAFPIIPHQNPLQSSRIARTDVCSSSSSSSGLSSTRRRRLNLVTNQNPTRSEKPGRSNSENLTQLQQYSLNTVESFCVNSMDKWYSKALSIKCPFLRRRSSDVLDSLEKVIRFLVIRHKSLDLIGPPMSLRTSGRMANKSPNLSVNQIADIIRRDWREDNHKGYYITGKLNTTIYRDDCFFDGPDPDMPVHGLRKYLNAASQLFDYQSSTATLISQHIVDDRTIMVWWEIKGVLHLPWHPKLPVWTGSTTYYIDDDGLIYYHQDIWDMSVFQAFTETFFPHLAARVWKKKEERTSTQT